MELGVKILLGVAIGVCAAGAGVFAGFKIGSMDEYDKDIEQLQKINDDLDRMIKDVKDENKKMGEHLDEHKAYLEKMEKMLAI
jgi:cell division protein FtsB